MLRIVLAHLIRIDFDRLRHLLVFRLSQPLSAFPRLLTPKVGSGVQMVLSTLVGEQQCQGVLFAQRTASLAFHRLLVLLVEGVKHEIQIVCCGLLLANLEHHFIGGYRRRLGRLLGSIRTTCRPGGRMLSISLRG